MDYHNRLERTFNPPATNGNGRHRLTPEPDQVIGAFEHRQSRRHRTATIIHIIGVLVLAGGLWAIASAVDSGLEHIGSILSTR